MNDTVEKRKEQEKEKQEKFAVQIVYNGVTKPLEVERNQHVTAVLQRAIALFGITQNPHLLSLFRQDGSLIPETDTVERAGLKPGQVLLLRPNAVKGGALRLAANIVPLTFRVFQDCGRGECECAVFWTGPAGDEIVDGLNTPSTSVRLMATMLTVTGSLSFGRSWRPPSVASRCRYTLTPAKPFIPQQTTVGRSLHRTAFSQSSYLILRLVLLP